MKAHIQTTNLSLRPFTSEDSAAVYRYWKSDPDWERYNESVPTNFTAQDAEQFVEDLCQRDRSEQPSWAITHNNAVVGIVALTFAEAFSLASIGYGIHADLQGRGFVAEAVCAILNQAFGTYPQLAIVQAHTHADNQGSIQLLEKLGFLQKVYSHSHNTNKGWTFQLRSDDWNHLSD